jgi:short-subunit dehydrogenase
LKGIVSGYSSGIGKAICEKLESCGYEIIKLQSRFEDTQNLEKEVKEILKTTEIDFLINCAGKGVFEPHEEINPKKIEELIAINLTAPILLSNLVLRSLKKTKGNIINIASIEATRHSKFSALYTATKSGLRDFSLSLFEEVRKSGVKVTSINPDMTMTPFFDELKFKPSSKEENHLLSSEVADVVYEVLTSKIAITDITLRSQYFGIEKK